MKKKFLNIYNLTILFTLGCFIGFVSETLFHFMKHHEYINKQGLLYGPFKPIYGFSLIIITALLFRFKNSKFKTFLFGSIIGLIFEFVSSLVLEKLFGIYIWTYKAYKYNIAGRVYLPYAILWGIMSLVWMCYILPKIETIINKYYSKKYKIFTILLLSFMIFNIIATIIVQERYKNRLKNENQNNIVEKFIDRRYPNHVVQRKFPKLRIVK